MRQYQAAKDAYPDAILFFRLGDFYEMFRDDAVIAARALDLTLTSRNKGAPDEVPMAGVPHHAAAGYIARLVELGHKVAICDQLGDPSKTKGIVPREVVRVVTPGLVTDSEQLDGRANHFLCALERGSTDGRAVGLAVLDLSTGELAAAIVDDSATLIAEVARLEPREVLVGGADDDLLAWCRKVAPRAALQKDEAFEEPAADALLLDAIGEDGAADAARSLAPLARIAAARTLRFARRCHPGTELPVRRISAWDPAALLRIDEVAQTHLELVRAADGGTKGSLLSVLDQTCTPAGARLLRRWLLAPLLAVAPVRRRLDAVEGWVVHAPARRELRGSLERVGDLERLVTRAALGQASPRELGALRDGLLAAPEIVEVVRALPDSLAREALGAESEIDVVGDLAEELSRALVDRPPPLVKDGGIVREGFDAELDETRKLKEKGTELIAQLETRLRESSQIPTLKVRYTRVFGWYIEVTRAHASKAPASFRRKQTVAGGERYSTEELDELQEKLLSAEERFADREGELFRQLLGRVGREADRVRKLAARLAEWDVFAALAEIAHRNDYVRPEVNEGESIEIEEGRHPVVEQLAAAGRFVPNDVKLDGSGERLWLVTGPNMAGKSTLMRQVALIVVLAQMGSYVPAKGARIGLVDRVLSRVGASDNLSRGESTFMVEMRETSAILRRATRRSLVVLDEIGRGTSTYDGLAIAWAVAEYLHDVVQCRALFATHYHELTELASSATHAANYSVSARELGDDVVFLHKLVHGAASRSYGVAVARLAGLPEAVLARAKVILSGLEGGGALPGGRPLPRAKRQATDGQLGLFQGEAPAPRGASLGSRVAAAAGSDGSSVQRIAELLRAIDTDRLTPLEALQLVAKWKGML